MKIIHTDKEITFTFPRYSRRSNPWDDEPGEEYPVFTGLIVRHNKSGNDWEEMGFAHTIDMGYKGKPDQVGGFIVMWYGEEEEFKKKCIELGLAVHEMEV